MNKVKPTNVVRDRLQGGNGLGEAIGNDREQRGYHGSFKAVMDPFTLAQGWQKCAIPTNNLGMARSKR
jgi:hypothetical protein